VLYKSRNTREASTVRNDSIRCFERCYNVDKNTRQHNIKTILYGLNTTHKQRLTYRYRIKTNQNNRV